VAAVTGYIILVWEGWTGLLFQASVIFLAFRAGQSFGRRIPMAQACLKCGKNHTGRCK
jgi:hypothetical protein